jgi:4,5:9,10-diseco-3-hydroxy-5,9,17-trioxoandrosta-1(10),2-diene-4-oate hydrolase
MMVPDSCEDALGPFEDRYVDVSTFRTRYWKAGNAGSAVVLLAGIGCSVLEWRKNIAALATRHRVYAFDMLGHGLTDKPQKNCYSIPELARFTLGFLTSQGEDRAHFVGNSLGGRIALECARLAPTRVKSMVLAAPAGIGCETALTMRFASVPVLGELLTRPSRAGTRMLWTPVFHDQSFVTKGFIETKYALACMPGAHQAVLATLRNFVSISGFRIEHVAPLLAVMRAMRQSTLIIWGRQDKLVPADHARILELKLPRSKTVLFDECGHLPQLEQPRQFNAAVLDFLRQAA